MHYVWRNFDFFVIDEIDNFVWWILGFGDEYFGTLEDGESNKLSMQEYKSVLNSKQVEDNLVRIININYVIVKLYLAHQITNGFVTILSDLLISSIVSTFYR